MSHASCWLRVCAGSALLLSCGTRAQAGDFFHRNHGECTAGCAAQTVQLPAQRVTVETAAPRVVVHETRAARVANFAPAPVVASFFVPAPVNMGLVGLSAPPAEEHESVSLDFSALRAAHDLERCQARAAAMKAIHAAQAEHLDAVMRRVSLAAAPPAAAPVPATKASASDKCCEDLKAQLQELNQRVDRLEQNLGNLKDVVKYHDDVIRKNPNVTIPPAQK